MDEPGDALKVLRAVWRSGGQTEEDLDCGPQKSCKSMANVGFDRFAEDDHPAAAWRARLAREGKLGGSTVRDLVLGPDR
ncbi:hypothetical protein VA596_27230 [Amycolatopsis sp., V23-08]|uniref:Uncharacterized protein n=1 Tax=Amycolatopsis heterodermiae TaxID=3110235 RepID=A0ABU5RAJ0_9PSEU|nr:hypothetical protein [Amycolatopsis sp., V23-08]MEA5363253.1 hypothetical protein [Amycolatopsis sp., V23-08]